MKIYSLCIFLVFMTLINTVLNKTENKLDKFLTEIKGNVAGYYYLQKLYHGDDAIDIIKHSQQSMALKYFTLNDKVLAVSPNLQKVKTIEEALQLETLFNKDFDNAATGACCKNVVYREFAGCKGQSCPKSVLGNRSPGIPHEIASNYCLELITNDNHIWRLCSDKAENISKLQTKINYNILHLKSPKGKVAHKVLEKFMLNNSGKNKDNSEKEVKNWHWDDQKSWVGKCANKNNLQSPINIVRQTVVNSKKNITPKIKKINFGVTYHFEDVHTIIKKHYNEIYVHFLNYAGLLRFTADNLNLVYQPQYISFRFPGEHLVDGQRYSGEVLIHLTELNPNRKTWVTNGMVISIPLNPTKDNPNLDFFESLNPDFWKVGVKKNGEYIPKQTMKKTKLQFSLDDLMKKATGQEPTYYSYVGSETTPPCTGNIIYLVLDKPLQISNCQFKVLRENSLLTDRPKEIHSRLTQEIKGRKVYEIKSLQNTPQIKSYLAQANKKWKKYNKAIKATLGGPKLAKKCAAAKGPAAALIKKPLRPKNLKALNRHIQKMNKKTLRAMRKKGPEGKIARKQARAAMKAESDSMDCQI